MSENVVTPSLSIPERIVRYWIPVGLMLSLMYFFSTDVFSGRNTSLAITWIMKLFGEDLNRSELGELLKRRVHCPGVSHGLLTLLR
jgi:hypothetical protein